MLRVSTIDQALEHLDTRTKKCETRLPYIISASLSPSLLHAFLSACFLWGSLLEVAGHVRVPGTVVHDDALDERAVGARLVPHLHDLHL